MDRIPQEQTHEQKSSVLEEFEFGVGGILLGAGTFLLMLFVLNYFNIISLSLVFPKYFGFLPHRQYSQQKPPAPVFNFTQREAPTSASPTPTPTLVSTLETCSVTKEGNPLVESIQTIKVKSATGSAEQEVIVGDFRGNINKTTFNSQKTEASIELISPRGDQTHTFNLKEEEGLVYDVMVGKDLQLSDLSAGQAVTMSFNCFKDQPKEKQFKITRISITGKL